MFPSDWGMSSLTTSVTRLHLCLVWRLRAACWWEESHWLGSVWLVRLASESRRENSIASLAHHNWHWLSSNSGRSLHAAVESVMLSPSCWVSQDESIVSCLSCWVCHVDSVILSLSCRVRHVESVMLSLSYWVFHVESVMLKCEVLRFFKQKITGSPKIKLIKERGGRGQKETVPELDPQSQHFLSFRHVFKPKTLSQILSEYLWSKNVNAEVGRGIENLKNSS